MGLVGDIFRGRVALEYKAEVDDAKIKLRELSGEQKKNAQVAIQGVEDQAKAHERLAGKIALGAGITAGVIAIGIQGFKKYEESVRLMSTTASADMDRLRNASHGLMTDIELMSVAAEGLNGRWKLSSAEMESVLGAAVTLERRGIAPLSEAAKKLGESMKKGEIEPLKELGIAYDENLAKTDKRGAAMKALATLSNESAGTYQTETEAITAHGTAFKNSIDQIASSIGRLVVAFGPLMDATASLVDLVAQAFEYVLPGARSPAAYASSPNDDDPLGAMMFRDPVTGSWVNFNGLFTESVNHAQSTAWNRNAAATAAQPGIDAANRRREEERQRAIAASGAAYADPNRGKYWDPKWGPKPAGWDGKPKDKARGGYTLNAAELDGGNWTPYYASTEGYNDNDRLSIQDSTEQKYFDAISGFGENVAGHPTGEWSTEKQPTMLERMFGKPSEVGMYADAISGLQDVAVNAWGTIGDAAASGYEAWVTGAQSAESAMKAVIGKAIMAEGQHMLMLSIREAGLGIASAAVGDFAGAGKHAAASALLFGGSIAAGKIAQQFDAVHTGPVGGAASGAGASASGIGLGGGVDNAPRNQTIVLGNGWEDESPRTRSAKIARANRMADAMNPPPRGVSYR